MRHTPAPAVRPVFSQSFAKASDGRPGFQPGVMKAKPKNPEGMSNINGSIVIEELVE